MKSLKDIIKENDPFYGCEVWLNEGCSHVDGLLCNYPECEILKKYRKDDSISLNLTAKQLTTLFNSIYDFTKRMAEANNVRVDVKAPKIFKKSTVVDLRNYLDIQKSIIEKAA